MVDEKDFKEFFIKEFPDTRKFILRGDLDDFVEDEIKKLKKILK